MPFLILSPLSAICSKAWRGDRFRPLRGLPTLKLPSAMTAQTTAEFK